MLSRSKVLVCDGRKLDLVEVLPKLSSNVLEDITVRTCFVTPLSRARQLVDARTNDAGPSPPVPPPNISYLLSGNNNLILEGSIREEAAEVLFETDNEMVSLASMVLDAILAVSFHPDLKQLFLWWCIKNLIEHSVAHRLSNLIGRESSLHWWRLYDSRIEIPPH